LESVTERGSTSTVRIPMILWIPVITGIPGKITQVVRECA
jgi:hypothetical protein